MALRGTGSKDFEVDSAWPVRRDGVLFTADIATWTAPGQQVNRGWLYQGPYKPVALLVLAPPALGAAKAALSRFIERMGSHFLPLSGLVQRNDPAARLRVAESAAEIDAAERTLLAAAARCDELGRRPDRDPLAEETVCRMRRVRGAPVRLGRRPALRGRRWLGAAGGRTAGPDFWRDVHGACIHAALTWDAAAHNFANALLGPAGA
ncbi:MAG: hypothetical protein R2755_08655 [Acidimicrobiales bacterium]